MVSMSSSIIFETQSKHSDSKDVNTFFRAPPSNPSVNSGGWVYVKPSSSESEGDHKGKLDRIRLIMYLWTTTCWKQEARNSPLQHPISQTLSFVYSNRNSSRPWNTVDLSYKTSLGTDQIRVLYRHALYPKHLTCKHPSSHQNSRV
jgi:hypothetical protein